MKNKQQNLLIEHRIRYLIPNALTLLSLLLGFIALKRIVDGQTEEVLLLVIGAAIIDGLDGLAARLLKSESSFGKILDSLCDLINFGVIPAILLTVHLTAYPVASWITGATFLSTCSIRLARFTCEPTMKKDYFIGLPSPVAGLLVLSSLDIFTDIEFGSVSIIIFTIILCLLMVSSYNFGKASHFIKRLSNYTVMITIFFVLSIYALSLSTAVFLLFFFYCYFYCMAIVNLPFLVSLSRMERAK
jgi:CDP-diacylglycerol---serine O-phosphatidyltransferase